LFVTVSVYIVAHCKTIMSC